MKKIKILLIGMFILALACVCFVGCTRTEQIASICLKGVDPEIPIEFQIGKFDYSKYTLKVSYDSGSVEEVALSEDMISELDRLKFYQAGDHTITVSYGGKTCEVKVSVKRQTFGRLRFPGNNVFTYDGNAHKVEIVGELPANASVSYIGGNSFINAGVYDVTAVVSCDGYVTERITTTVTINQAKYDMSNVKFEPKSVVYDGRAHSVEISGKLPAGVSGPIYYINGNKLSSVVDAGEYKVTASFTSNDPNYEPVQSLETILTIERAEYNIDEIDLIFKEENGEEIFFPWKAYDGSGVTFEIKDFGNLKNKVSVAYTVKNKDGEVISFSNTDTKIKEAGAYTITVNFTLLDGKNYKAIEPMVFDFEVSKATLDTSGLQFESSIVEYNGEMQSLEIILPNNLDATKIDISYEYYLDGDDEAIKVDGKNVFGVTDAGEYTVKAIFTVKDPNYRAISEMQAKLVIKKKTVDASQFGFYNTDLTYTGDSLKPTFRFADLEAVKLIDFYVSVLDGEQYIEIDAAIEPGEYLVTTIIEIVDTKNCIFNNGQSSIEVSETFVIREAEIDISSLGFKSGNALIVFSGTSTSFGFNTKNVAGLIFEAAFYAVVGDELVCVVEPEAYVPNEYGMINVEFDSTGLDVGGYVMVVNVSTADENYILSNGETTAIYSFKFDIENS